MDTKGKIFILIPVFNEAPVINSVIDDIKGRGFNDIIVVDDGSSDDTYSNVQRIEGVVVIRHRINRGKGASTKTGMEAAKLLGADIVVTMDGDGQHDPTDIDKLLEPIISSGFDVVLGSRLMNKEGMPFYKIVHNKIANLITWLLYGLLVTDSQSGFRAYSQNAIDRIDTQSDRYEYDSEIIQEIRRHKLKYIEIPIKVRYTEYSKGKKQKQSLLGGIETLYKMIWRIIS